jgi:hypothetical protein
MAHLNTSNRPDLRREFSEASPTGDEHGELLRSIRKQSGKVNDWDWLLRSRVIVILNEAGAGKTTELMDQARRLGDQRPGFFLRIERLCTQAFDTAFESQDDYRRFERWQRSRGDAVIFLDSVDEAKLPRDLDRNPLSLAIRSVERALAGQLHRIRIVISSRPSAWTTELELAEVRRLVGVFRARSIESGDGDAPLERFVSLAPLDAEQRQTLVDWAKAPPGFLRALATAGAIDFARTPLDLLDLVEAYAEEVEAGRSGAVIFESLAEMTDRAIIRRIAEHGADRPRNQLPASRARLGARRIAAACVLAQELAIQLPGSRGQGINAIDALGGAGHPWARPEVDQLLACGLFTAAWEGSVRFQHRRTMERLAAEAFDGLLQGGMALEALARILMPSSFDEVIVPQPFAQTLGWLASINPAFRHHVLLNAPQLLIDMGDPGSHPANVRDEALRRHVARYAGGIWRGEWFDYAMLRRFADHRLEPTCRELLRSAPADEPKKLILDIAEVAQFKDCLPEILDIVADTSMDIDLRVRAVTTASAIGDSVHLDQLRRAAIRFRPPPSEDGHVRLFNNRFRLACVVACRPEVMSLSDALGVLLRLEALNQQYSSSGDYDLADVLAASCPSDKLPWLLKCLARLCWIASTRTFGSHDPPRWSHIGSYLLPVLNDVVVRVINECPELHESPLLIAQVEMLSATRSVHMGRLWRQQEESSQDSLAVAMQAAPRLRRAIFFMAAAIPSGRRADEPGFVLERMSRRHDLYGDHTVAPSDLDWMAEDYIATSSDRNRKALVDAITYRLHTMSRQTRPPQIIRFEKLARSRKDDAGLVSFRNARDKPFRRAKWALERHWRKQRWLRLARERKQFFRRTRLHLMLLWYRRGVRSGARSGLIWNAAFGEGVPDDPLATVVKVYGHRVADDIAIGTKAYARSQEIRSYSGRWTWAGHLALTGWERIALDEPDVMERLKAEEACRALWAALGANNFPNWATVLAEREVGVFRTLILPLIEKEMSWRDGSLRYAPALSLLSRQVPSIQQAMAAEVLAYLSLAEPDLGVIIPSAKVIAADPALRPDLIRLAARRFREYIAEGQTIAAASWFAVWLENEPEEAWRALQRHGRAFAPHGDALLRDVLTFMGEGAPIQVAPPHLLAEMAVDYMRLLPQRDDDDSEGEITKLKDAQRLGGQIPGLIAKNTSQEAREILKRLAEQAAFRDHPSWMSRVLRDQAAAAAAPQRWSPADTAGLMATFLKRPASAEEFRQLVERQIESIVDDLATSEFDRRGLLRDVLERDVRAFFGEALQQRSQGWFSVTQETVTAGEKRTDLRIEGRTQVGELVIVELKLAGSSWTGDQLVDHVTTQLVDQYLISRRVRHGIYLVVNLGLKTRWPMEDGSVQTFEGLVDRMRALVPNLLKRPNVDAVTILPVRISVPVRVGRSKNRGADTSVI